MWRSTAVLRTSRRGCSKSSCPVSVLFMFLPLQVLTVVAGAGPVTVVLERIPGALSAELNPGVQRIGATHGSCTASTSCSAMWRAGIRVPDSAFIRSIARSYGGALALTSANVSGGMSTLAVNEFAELWDKARYMLRLHTAR